MNSMTKPRLSRQAMCDRLAMEFQDGWVVNLGAGIPVLCSNYPFESKTVLFHSENGVLGYGAIVPEGEEDLHLVNAGNQYVNLIPGAAILHHADSFMLIRGGRLNVTVLGSYEVAENGDFANWKITGKKGGGIGGAMDLAVGARQVFIAMEHTTPTGAPRLRRRCSLPVTARGRVKLVVTDLGLFEVVDSRFVLREIAPGFTPEDVQEATEADLVISSTLREFAMRETSRD